MSDKNQTEAKLVLESMISLLGLCADVEPETSDRGIILSLKSEDPGRIIGRNGLTIDALQLLINKMLRRSEDNFPPIILDVDGYKKSRRDRTSRRRTTDKKDDSAVEFETVDTQIDDEPAEPLYAESCVATATELPNGKKSAPVEKQEGNIEKAIPNKNNRDRSRRKVRNDRERGDRSDRPERSSLSDERVEAITKQAIEASKEVKRWGDDVTLPPMSSAERRIVHLALQNDPEVSTESNDTGIKGKKRVIVRSK
ncbi:MAG: protein jag [Lentisphaeria bacterium]